MAILFAIGIQFLNLGIRHSDSCPVSTTPFFTLGSSLSVFRREIITLRQVAMVFIVLFGVVLIVVQA